MNILFVTANRLGDAVLSSGLLAHLIERNPNARITIACGPVAAPLFAATPNVECVIALAKKPWAAHWFELWLRSTTTVWDIVVDLRSSALAWLLLARKRYVLHNGNDVVHRTEMYSNLFGLRDPAMPRLFAADAHRARAAELIPESDTVLAIGPTANWGGKQWPAASFSQLVERLTRSGARFDGADVAILGSARERPAAEPVIRDVAEGRRIDLVGTEELLTLYACLERCALYIGNDSGLMHLAAASGAPTLGLFGPSREIHYAPRGRNAAHVRTPETYEELVSATDYDYRDQTSRMTSLTVDAVEQAALDFMSSTGTQ
jgi:heptosyltransferase-3